MGVRIKMKKIIMVSGLKRSGKDYISNIIKNELTKKGYTVDIFAFAKPIKDIITKTLNISLDELDLYKNEKSPISINGTICTDMRKVLQDFGEVMKDTFGKDVWVKAMLNNINNSKADIIIISDFRFLIEYESLKSLDHNITTINVLDFNLKLDDAHPSERELIDNDFKYDICLDNTAKNDNIVDHVKSLIRTIFKHI